MAKISVTTQQALALLNAHQALDGYERAVKDGAGERIVREFYKLTGLFRLMIAKNINQLQPTIEAFNATSQQLHRERSGGSAQISDPVKAAEYQEEVRKLLGEPHEFDLGMIAASELALDTNPIPPSLLAALAPVLHAN